MTHEELLAKLSPARYIIKEEAVAQLNALRAVVELPKETNWDGGWEDADAFQHGYRLAMSKVIQAIEKELK